MEYKVVGACIIMWFSSEFKCSLIALINPSTHHFERPRFLKQMTNYSDYLETHDEGIVLSNFPILK